MVACAEQRDDLKRLVFSANRAEAGRARAILLSLSRWNSAAIGAVFGRRTLCEGRLRRVREERGLQQCLGERQAVTAGTNAFGTGIRP
ncbi:MAG: hypothetical protein ACRECZ_05255 [Methylocella sp.]